MARMLSHFLTKKPKYIVRVFILIELIAAMPVLAYDSIPQMKGISVGATVGYSQFKERLINNLRYSGVTTGISASYSFGNDWNHTVGLSVSSDFISNRYSMNAWTWRTQLDYRLVKRIGEADIFVGGFFNSTNFFYNNEYYDAQHNYWASHIDLGLAATKYFVLNDNITFALPVRLPLLGFKSRPASDRQFILNEADMKVHEVLERINSNYGFGFVGFDFFYFDAGFDMICRVGGAPRLTVGYHIYVETDKIKSNPEYEYISNSLVLKYAF